MPTAGAATGYWFYGEIYIYLNLIKKSAMLKQNQATRYALLYSLVR
ncbi:MAG TPA: hypothetical protein DEB17_04670 [Chlorobaculum sp.]|uniref:Uncharacterized protein n=1 Tax=Chlorobaculum tepidum (strain ATCC 49652 / DSM 12025 / NBRC 103806 / TLS) TaxID=194439 RepID=Q8KB49_CHLTE|nr:hypothetical protein CT1944 [Chlorobaculum tepidum TLS]HBU23277.1 hypothetical protein [Chlorobaculum sp.]